MINSSGYVSQAYPSLSQLVEITHNDYAKLRKLMSERGELEKFIKWQRGKFIKIITQGFLSSPNLSFNSSKYQTVR